MGENIFRRRDMKIYLAFILAILLILTGCVSNIEPEVPESPVLEEPVFEKPAPEEKPDVEDKPALEEIPPIDFPDENDVICREILFCFGAMENAVGDYITPKGQPTAFDCGFFDDAAKAPAETYFYFMFHFMPEEAKGDSVMGKRYIYFEGADFFIYADKFFGADAEYLKSLDIYHEYGEFFFHETEGMHFDAPLEVLSYSVDGDIMEINIRRTICDGETVVDSVLRAEFHGIGDFKYLSYLEKTE